MLRKCNMKNISFFYLIFTKKEQEEKCNIYDILDVTSKVDSHAL